jgi:hypothetical protein
MEIVKQLSVLAANQPGTLANICGMLRDERVNIRGITVADHVDHALVRMVVDDSTRAAHLMGEAGLVVLEGDVIRIDLAFGPGSLEYVAEALGQGGLNIAYVYATEPPGEDGLSSMYVMTDDNPRGLATLRKKFGN